MHRVRRKPRRPRQRAVCYVPEGSPPAGNLEKRADDLNGSSVVDDMDGIDELEVPIDDDIPEIELEEIDKELGGDSNLGSDDMDDMDEENKEEDGEN